ncbi:MAG: hypothetical protein ABFS16_01265 [Bacteroidota bacterium]
MDDLIIIILTLIIAAVGAIGQIKKKRKPQPASENKSSGQDFWDMLTDEADYPKEPKQRTIIEEPDVIDKVPEKKPVYQFSARNEAKSEIKEELKTVLEKEKSPIKEEEKFSLRKAVIYSEILNRKYS